jgi:hypothetical protein
MGAVLGDNFCWVFLFIGRDRFEEEGDDVGEKA